MIDLARIVQRVRLRGADGALRRLPRRVFVLVVEVCQAVLGSEPHRPVHIGTAQLAVRLGVDEKTVRRGRLEAAELGLIKLVAPGAGSAPPWGASHAPHGALIHPALIAAALATGGNPLQHPELVFPRAWDEVDPRAEPRPAADIDWAKHPVTWGVKLTAGVKLTGRKGDLSSRPPRAVVRGPADPPAPAPRRGVPAPQVQGPAGPGPAPAPRAGGRDPRRGGSKGVRAEGDKKKSWPPGGAGRKEAMAGLGGGKYWTWLAGGWGDGVVTLQCQRRGGGGDRGGVFNRRSAAIGEAAAAAAALVRQVGAWQGRVELYWRPNAETREMHPVLLVDDLHQDGGQLARLVAQPGVAIVETSPNCYQATLLAPRALTAVERLAVHKALARRYGGDPGAVSADQPRRLPGSINYKPALREPFAARLLGEPTPGTLSDALLAELLADGAAPAPAASDAAKGCAGGTCSGARGASEEDMTWTHRQLNAGRSEDEIVADLAARAGARGRHGLPPGVKEHEAYARLTFTKCVAYRKRHALPGRGA